MSNKFKHIGLFEGIGGFSLAARWAGWETVAWCEWNEFGQKVLRHHFPEAEGYGDITKTNFKKYANTIDVLTGGFPCQPFSTAGKRKGTDDERYLWHEMLRAINEIKPKFVIAENVYGITNIDGGLVFEQVCLDLEANGYEVQPYIIPACAKNAPHRRDRVWFVAYTKNYGCNERGEGIDGRKEYQSCNGDKGRNITTTNGKESNAPHPNCNGFNGSDSQHEEQPSEGGEYAQRNFEQNVIANTESIGQSNALENGELERRRFRQSNQRNAWDSFPSVSPICTGDDGLSNRLDSITFSKWRNESIKAGGNAIVPQVAYEIFKVINQMNENDAF